MEVAIGSNGAYPNTINYLKSGNFMVNGRRVPKIKWRLDSSLYMVERPTQVPTEAEANAFVNAGFDNEPPVREDLRDRFHVLAAFGGGKSGAHVYKVIGQPIGGSGAPRVYILKLYHERPWAAFVDSEADKAPFARLVFSLSPGDGPNYDAAMKVLNRVGGPAMHALLGRALERMRAEGVADARDPSHIIACIKRNFGSSERAALVALAQATIHYFRALKDVEVGMLLQGSPTKIAPYIYEYGFIRGDPFAVEGGYVTEGDITCYAVSEYLEGYDFADFARLLYPGSGPECAPAECRIATRRNSMNIDLDCGQSPCAVPKNISSYLAASLLFKIAYAMNIFNTYLGGVGCHRDLHPGNIKILANSDKSREGWLRYWTQASELSVDEQTFRVIGPPILLIDFDLSISKNPLINRTYLCERRNPALGTVGLQNLIAATLKFMFKHLNLKKSEPVAVVNWNSEQEQNASTAAKVTGFISKLLFNSSRSLGPQSQLWTKLGSHQKGVADIFAWKILVMSLLDYVPACMTFRDCMISAGPFQAMKVGANVPEEEVNMAIEKYKTDHPEEYAGLFRMYARLKGGGSRKARRRVNGRVHGTRRGRR